MKNCNNCKKDLDESNFYGKYYGTCKDCHNQKRRNCKSYIDKRKKRKYDLDSIKADLAIGELSKHKIAMKHNIPKSTFYDYIKSGRIVVGEDHLLNIPEEIMQEILDHENNV